MVSKHMLTVGRDSRNWQAHSKDFSLQLSLSKRSFTSLLFWAYSKIPFSETIPPFPCDHSKIRLMRPLQEGPDIGQLRPLRNEGDLTVHLNNGNYNGWRLRILGEFEGSEEFPDWYDLGKLPLWNLSDYWSCQYPRPRCNGERPEHGALKTIFVKKTLRQEISTGKIAHGNDKGRNTVIRDVITIDTVVTELS